MGFLPPHGQSFFHVKRTGQEGRTVLSRPLLHFSIQKREREEKRERKKEKREKEKRKVEREEKRLEKC